MNWIITHIDLILLWLFCWTGVSDILHWYFHGGRLYLQVGVIWLVIGLIVHGWSKG